MRGTACLPLVLTWRLTTLRRTPSQHEMDCAMVRMRRFQAAVKELFAGLFKPTTDEDRDASHIMLYYTCSNKGILKHDTLPDFEETAGLNVPTVCLPYAMANPMPDVTAMVDFRLHTKGSEFLHEFQRLLNQLRDAHDYDEVPIEARSAFMEASREYARELLQYDFWSNKHRLSIFYNELSVQSRGVPFAQLAESQTDLVRINFYNMKAVHFAFAGQSAVFQPEHPNPSPRALIQAYDESMEAVRRDSIPSRAMVMCATIHGALRLVLDALLPDATDEDHAVSHILLNWNFDCKHISEQYHEPEDLLELACKEAPVLPTVGSTAFVIGLLPRPSKRCKHFFPVHALAVDLVQKTENLLGALRSLHTYARFSILPPELREPFVEAAREFTKAICYYKCKKDKKIKQVRASLLERIPHLRGLLWQDQAPQEEMDRLLAEWETLKGAYYALFGIPLTDLEIVRLICDSSSIGYASILR